MSDEMNRALGEIDVDRANLYREEVITDLKIATIRVLTPITPDGAPDPSRATRFIAQTQLLSQAGPVPVQTPIEAANLAEALELFPAAIQRGVEALLEEARQLQRDEASRIVVPNVGPGGKIIT